MARFFFFLCVLAIGCCATQEKLGAVHRFSSPYDSHVIPTYKRSSLRDVSQKLSEMKRRLESSGEPTSFPDSFFAIVPEFVGSVIPSSSILSSLSFNSLVSDVPSNEVTWESTCYERISATLTKTAADTLVLTLNGSHRKSSVCVDTFLIASVYSAHVKEIIDFKKQHTITFSGISDDEQMDIAENGFRLFMFHETIKQDVEEVYELIRMFVGGLGTGDRAKIPEYQEKENLEFFKEWMNVTFETRVNAYTPLPESAIQSGDFFGILRMDGLDPMLAYGMGSITGHTTTAIRHPNGTMMVCESQDGWYWPKHGIQCNTYTQWIKWASDASYNVVHLPLKDSVRKLYNETSAWEFINELVDNHIPYGYHNLFFGWLDTTEDNWVPPLSPQIIQVAFALLDRIAPAIADKVWNEPLNQRLNTKGLNTSEIYKQAQAKGLSFGELISIPEQDDWIYSDGPSMVCCSFVLRVYKSAGLFGDLTETLQGTEFTNRDVYQLNIFDLTVPDSCKQNDPDLPYCQILGKYRLKLDFFNTVEPYEHMCEKCPTIPPLYEYPPTC